MSTLIQSILDLKGSHPKCIDVNINNSLNKILFIECFSISSGSYPLDESEDINFHPYGDYDDYDSGEFSDGICLVNFSALTIGHSEYFDDSDSEDYDGNSSALVNGCSDYYDHFDYSDYFDDSDYYYDDSDYYDDFDYFDDSDYYDDFDYFD